MFEGNTYDVILERMLSRVPDDLDKREGSVIFDTHSPTALEFQYLYIELERIIKEAYGDTASRDYLILRCAERGISPYKATNAVLKGEFTPMSIDVSGQRFNVGDVNFVVGDKISDGIYKVQCETAGKVGNQCLGEMLPIDYIQGLETARLTEVLVPGEDEEDTEELRKRYFASFNEQSFGGNIKDYLIKTNALPGVGSTKVTRVWNSDIRPSELIPGGEVQTWYDSALPTLQKPVADWLTAVYTACMEKQLTTGGTVLLTILNSDHGIPSGELISAVQTEIDPVRNAGEGAGIAPIGHVVNVRPADGVSIDVRSQITFENGYDWAAVKSEAEGVISDYLLQLRESWADLPNLTVRISQIELRLLGITGIVDVAGTTINGKAENLELLPFEVPIFGSVSV